MQEPIQQHDVPERAVIVRPVTFVQLGMELVTQRSGELAQRLRLGAALRRIRKRIDERERLPLGVDILRTCKAPRSERDMRIGMKIAADLRNDEFRSAAAARASLRPTVPGPGTMEAAAAMFMRLVPPLVRPPLADDDRRRSGTRVPRSTAAK